jgi:hypothetical protein
MTMNASYKKLMLCSLAAGLLLLQLGIAAAADCDQPLQTVVNHAPQSSIEGSAELCIDDGRISVSMRTENHTPGDAYTIWFAYLDDPATCGNYAGGTPGVCSDPDFILPANSPVGVFGRMDGHIAGAGGRVHFGHGPASTTDNRFLARQLLTPQLPVLGAPGEGAPGDGPVGHGVALAVFNIP